MAAKMLSRSWLPCHDSFHVLQDRYCGMSSQKITLSKSTCIDMPRQMDKVVDKVLDNEICTTDGAYILVDRAESH